MVRVFRCFGFKAQVVLPVVEEPIAVCTSTNSVYVATSAGSLEVFRLQKGKGWKNVCTINTEGLAQQLAYSEKENYLATLEMKQYRQQSLTYIKTYLELNKWDNKKEFLTSLRLAEKTPVILPDQPVLEVIEVLTAERAGSICVCSHTGALAVACYKKINIYLVQEKYSAECSRSYKDIVHSLVIDWGHEIRRVIINESYIAVFSHRYAHVFKLNFHNGSRKSGIQMNKSASLMVASACSSTSQLPQQQPIDISLLPSEQVPFQTGCLSSSASTSSFVGGGSRKPPPADSGALVSIQNDETYVQWVFSSDHHGSRNKRRSFGQGTRHLAQISGLANMPAPIYLPKLHGNSGINGSTKSLPKVIVHIKDKLNFKNGKVKADTLLYKIAKSGIPWEHFQLLCIYSAEGNEFPSNADSDFPLQSSKCNSKMEMFCYLGNYQEGCLYSLSPPAVQRLSAYRYTSPALQVVISPTMLFVVTKAGIETYTSRAATFALFRRNTFDNIERTIPPVDLEPCLCGIQPFLGAVEVSVIDSPPGTIMESHVILLSKVTETSNTMWSLYALEPYTAMDTYKDLIVFSTKYQDSGQEAYLHVLQEAHLILRGPVIDSEIECLGEYQDLFDESCQKLGDFYAWHPTSDWKLCLPYYNMAGLRLREALNKVTKLNEQQQAITFRNGKGFLHYLRHKIFGTYDLSDLTQDEGDLILSVFYKCSGLDVSAIILLSQLKNYSPEKVLIMMKDIMKHDQTFSKQSKRSYLNHLACTLLHLDLCETDPAEMELSMIPKVELVHICVQHPQLMHSDFVRLSPLAQLMRKCLPSVLLEILVKLHDNGQLAYTTALELLQVKGSLEIYRNAHIKEFIELLLQDKKRINIFPEISNLLVNIYLQRLCKWEAPGRLAPHTSPSKIHLPQGVGHFAVRHAWLDFLPPFQGAKSYQTVCHYLRSPAEIHQQQSIACPCINCNEDLLKLQSLLCSPYAKETLFQTVEIAFESTASVSGRISSSSRPPNGELHNSRLSLDLLCKISIDVCDALDTIVADHPHILAEFCASMLDSQPETWKYLMTKFHDILTTDSHDKQLYRSVFQDLLSKLVDKVQTADLLLLIPPDASVSYFLPYLEQRCINDQLDALQRIMVEKGQRLKKME